MYMMSHPQQVLSKSMTKTQLREMKNASLQGLPFTLPTLAEQQQIVAEVEARITVIDQLEAELNRQITRSNRLRQSALAAAFSGTF